MVFLELVKEEGSSQTTVFSQQKTKQQWGGHCFLGDPFIISLNTNIISVTEIQTCDEIE